MTVRDIAREDVVHTGPDTSVSDIATTMRDENVGSVVVVEDGAPVGLVTDRDIAIEVCEAGADPESTTARDIMTEDLFTVDVDAGIYEAIELASEANVRRIPVVDDGDLVGIVTLDDFIVLLSGELAEISTVVQSESPPY